MRDLGAGALQALPDKDAVLAEMLVSISEELLAGRGASGSAAAPDARATRWSRWSSGTSTSRCTHRPLIVVQDRDWESLPDDARERVRTLQREYVDLWAAQLRGVRRPAARTRARAGDRARGLRSDQLHPAQQPPARAELAALLRGMAPPRWACDRAVRARYTVLR